MSIKTENNFSILIIIMFYILLYHLFTNSTFAQTGYFGPYLGQEPPGTEPIIFVPVELRSNPQWFWHGSPVFTPDGREFYMDLYETNQGFRIDYMVMNENDEWSAPQRLIWEGYESTSPTFIDNSDTLFFLADRPDGRFYKSLRSSGTWSPPQAIYIPVPSNFIGGWSISITKEKTIYTRFRIAEIPESYDIYLIRNSNGIYLEPERLDDNINSSYRELSAFIDPDEEYIIVESDRPGGYGGSDLYISFKTEDNTWTPAINMGESINTSASEECPYVSPDGLYLFFISDREQLNPYWVDAQIIDDLRISVDINEKNVQLPEKFQLNQNYPNPFNPSTITEFAIPEPGFVTLKVYDALGNEVATLVNEEKQAGEYEVEFNGIGLPSGVYFCQLIVKDYLETKKMILIK